MEGKEMGVKKRRRKGKDSLPRISLNLLNMISMHDLTVAGAGRYRWRGDRSD